MVAASSNVPRPDRMARSSGSEPKRRGCGRRGSRLVPEPQVRSTERRCAIYTRKSSEEGLEQDFNSLHAQRESCEAYIKSQKHEGWVALPVLYDDGGYSGGSIERPALKKLLSDIQSREWGQICALS